jgi:hypothetical protein
LVRLGPVCARSPHPTLAAWERRFCRDQPRPWIRARRLNETYCYRRCLPELTDAEASAESWSDWGRRLSSRPTGGALPSFAVVDRDSPNA